MSGVILNPKVFFVSSKKISLHRNKSTHVHILDFFSIRCISEKNVCCEFSLVSREDTSQTDLTFKDVSKFAYEVFKHIRIFIFVLSAFYLMSLGGVIMSC